MELPVYVITVVIALAGMSARAEGNPEINPEPGADEVRRSVEAYGTELKTTLKDALESAGPAAAIKACAAMSQPLSSDASRATGWSVRRVSHGARNPLATPDTYEAKGLDELARRLKAGEKTPDKYEVVTENGVRYVRYMKAIPTQKVCLTCHGPGEEMDDVVKKRLKSLYPHDRASGFRVGDLRGAFSVKVKAE